MLGWGFDLNKVTIEKRIFKQRSEGGERLNFISIWGKSVLGRWISKFKCLEKAVCLMCQRQHRC